MSQTIPTKSPYPGLRPYREDEQDNFYGRDKDSEILSDKLLANRLTLLFAASGVGKSSLLNAAVIPELKSPTGKNLPVIYHNDWVKPPLQSLGDNIRTSLESSYPTLAPVSQNLHKEKHTQTLAELLQLYTLFSRHPLILILDQFEEFFRYQSNSKEFKPFIKQLTEIILNSKLPVSICLSMREDFALELNAFKPELPTILFENFYRLEKLSPASTQQAILEPLKKAGYAFEDGLLDELLQDLLSRELDRDPNQLTNDKQQKTAEPPYLQIVCSQLWKLDKNSPDKIIRKTTYHKAGKARGLVKTYIDKQLNQFTDKEKQIASKAFDYLVGKQNTKVAYTAEILAQVIRSNQSTLKQVLDKLEKQWILRKQKRDSSTWYELYHDMFSPSIESWNKAWKKQQRKKQRWIMGSIIAILLLTIGFLVESFIWVLNNNFPANYLFKQQEFRLMHWGLKPEPLPIMKKISVQKKAFEIGELNEDFINTIKSQPEYMKNFGIPSRTVSLQDDYYASQYEISYNQYDYFVWQEKKSGNNKIIYPTSSVRDTQRGNKAVTYVSQEDAVTYTKWLNKKTGDNYRLPTEIEWEYAARANSKTTFWWGDNVGKKQANCKNCSTKWDGLLVAPVGQFKPNNFGLYDTAGNVWEWTCTMWQEKLSDIDEVCAGRNATSTRRVIRGGSWYDDSDWLRSSSRNWNFSTSRYDDVGFRVFRFSRQDK